MIFKIRNDFNLLNIEFLKFRYLTNKLPEKIYIDFTPYFMETKYNFISDFTCGELAEIKIFIEKNLNIHLDKIRKTYNSEFSDY